MAQITQKKQAENAIKWINTLTYGGYKQDTGRLGNKTEGFCCLGLGCHILDVEYWDEEGNSDTFADLVGLRTVSGEYDYDVLMNNLKDKSIKYGQELRKVKPEAFKGYDENLRDLECDDCYIDLELVSLNDDLGFSFVEIAKMLRQFPELYFMPKVAKKIAKHFKK